MDPTGQHVVIGFNDFRGASLNPISFSGFAYSDDGGATFKDGGQLPVTSNGQLANGTKLPQVFGDPIIKYVPGGNGCQFIYLSIMVKGFRGTAPNFTGTAQTLSIHRSSDCGHTWEGPFEVDPATDPTGVLSGNNARDAADKENIDIDPDTGRVMVSWSNFTSTTVIPGGVQIRTTFSDNIMAGNPPVWSASVVVNPGATTLDTASQPAFAGNGSGNVYVVWSSSSFVSFAQNTRVATSTDNGATFSPPVTLLANDFFTNDWILGNDRIHSFPAIAVDNSPGPNKGNVYVVYAGNILKDGSDVYFQRSVDGGKTFSGPVPLNSRPGADRSQWFPALAVDSLNGRVHVMYDDQGVAASGDLMQMSWAYSDDGGQTWSQPSALTQPFHAGYGNDANQPNLGDYNGAVAQNGTLYAAFSINPYEAFFNDGQPNATTPYPSFLGNLVNGGIAPAPGFAKVTTGAAALDLGVTTFTESGGNGFIDAGDQVKFTIPLRNYDLNPFTTTKTYAGIHATLSTSTPGVSFQRSTVTYPAIAPGTLQNNAQAFVYTLAPDFVPGTKIDFDLDVTSAQGDVKLQFTQNTGTPVGTTIFAENFDGVAAGALPAGWGTIHAGGNNTVPWTTNNTFCGTTSNGLFHANANDGLNGNHTRFERVASPNIVIPATSEFVTVEFDICYDTEDDPNFNVLAYDGADLRITDFTTGHFARANLAEAFAEIFTTGNKNHYPKHLPRSSSSAYFQDISAWAGDSHGFQHVFMRFDGMAGDTIQLRPDYTQDSNGICSDVRPGHSCGVIIDNVVVKSFTSKSDELAKIVLTPVAGAVNQWTGVVRSQASAPAGGITVHLSSSSPGQTTITPDTLVIPQGSQVSPAFTVSVDPAARGVKVILTATGPSNTRTVSLLVQ